MWNETFELELVTLDTNLQFEVTDYDRWTYVKKKCCNNKFIFFCSAHDPMGHAVINLKDLNLVMGVEKMFWVTLTAVPKGEVQFGITATKVGTSFSAAPTVAPTNTLGTNTNNNNSFGRVKSKFATDNAKPSDTNPTPAPVVAETKPASSFLDSIEKFSISAKPIDKPSLVVAAKVEEDYGTHFCDAEFPADVNSLYNSAELDDPNELAPGIKRVIKWLRPMQINAKAQLFVDGSNSGDAVQGLIGNCWRMLITILYIFIYIVVGALSVLGTRQDILDSVFIQVPNAADPSTKGKYVLRLFKEGKWVNVTIDDRLPCNEYGKLVFGKCADANEFW